jgi:8-oxo-dGTP pyrophosphatase MutT (NUDIX family)
MSDRGPNAPGATAAGTTAPGLAAAAPVEPSPAATLILVRARGCVPEILLLKRSAQARFMPNAYVFPGGAVDCADAADEAYAVCRGLGDAQASERLALPANGLRFFVAAIREAFEECGLLLAYDTADRIVDLSGWDEGSLRRLRAQVCAGRPGLAAICRLNGWRLAVDGLAYFDHWITPPDLKRRFDTRFFIARAPAQQAASLAGDEMSGLVWRGAAEALAGHLSGELLLMQATRTILGEIARFDGMDALFAFAHSGRKIVPTKPGSGAAEGTPAG